MLWANFIAGSILVVATFTIHFLGLVFLSAMLRRGGHHPANLTTVIGQGVSILFIVLMLFILHSVEVGLYAIAYLAVGALDHIEEALYFSTTTFTTVGFGDLIMDPRWRMFAASESMNGFLLIGWSTAFLVSVTARVRAFEASVDSLDD